MLTFVSTLPLFESFILIFEQTEPNIQKLYDKLKSVVKSFLGCFLRLKDAKIKQLAEMDISNTNF